MSARTTNTNRLWLLNLDSDLELEGRQAPRRAHEMLERRANEVAGMLLGEGDRRLGDPPIKPAAGIAWCPTPSAVKRLRDAGAEVDAPSIDVLRVANDRALSHELHPWPGTQYVRRRDELLAGGARLLKPAFSFAGRGMRAIGSSLTEHDERWLKRALQRGGVRVEPRLTLELEVGVPGFVRPSGEVEIGLPVSQDVRRGQWIGSTPGPVHATDALRESARRVGQRLSELGYFGPFGVDAFRSEERGWNLLSEINARYTMGWALGWQDWDVRPDGVRV